MYSPRRSKHNPVVAPSPHRKFDEYAAFNGCPVEQGKKTHLIYRSMAMPKRFENLTFYPSSISIADRIGDQGHFKDHRQFITPKESWDAYGCEDPRTTKLGSKYYTFYTAISGFPYGNSNIRVGVAVSKDLKTINARHQVTPFNAKAMALFPEKIDGKYTVILAAHTDEPPAKMCIAQCHKEEDLWSPIFWHRWHNSIDENVLHIPKKDTDHLEVGAPPIKTKWGWLLVYSHIQNYFTENKIFGIEAVLLDLKNPLKVIAKTKGPILVPEERYEKYGQVQNITFPSGVLINEDTLHIFYGGADTVCAEATVSLSGLVANMEVYYDEKGLLQKNISFNKAKEPRRAAINPIITPIKSHAWEARATFNPTAIDIAGKVHIFYRAMSLDNTSTIGYAISDDGISISERLDAPIYVPRAPFEGKNVPGGNSGCEDARVTKIGDRIYMTYTAYNGTQNPAIALTSLAIDDLLMRRWNWTMPILVSKDGVDDKDGCIFPEKIRNKFMLVHRVEHKIVVDFSPTLEFKNRNEFIYHTILAPRPGMWDAKKVGLAMTPIAVPHGWLMIYHGIGEDGVYRAGAALLDKKNPEDILGRTALPIFSPEMEYEKNGQIGNVVFPCGAVVRKGVLYLYYGGADSVVGVATVPMIDVMKMLGR